MLKAWTCPHPDSNKFSLLGTVSEYLSFWNCFSPLGKICKPLLQVLGRRGSLWIFSAYLLAAWNLFPTTKWVRIGTPVFSLCWPCSGGCLEWGWVEKEHLTFSQAHQEFCLCNLGWWPALFQWDTEPSWVESDGRGSSIFLGSHPLPW